MAVQQMSSPGERHCAPSEALGKQSLMVVSRYQHGNAKTDPLYDPAEDLQVSTTLDMGQSGQQHVKYYHLHKDNVDWVFVDHPSYHRSGGKASLYPR